MERELTPLPYRWANEDEIARLLGLSAGTLRSWRWLDKRDGRRRGGLVYRRFGRSVRYLITPDLLGEAPPDGREAA